MALVPPTLPDVELAENEDKRREYIEKRTTLLGVRIRDCDSWFKGAATSFKPFLPLLKKFCKDRSVIASRCLAVPSWCGKEEKGQWDTMFLFINPHHYEEEEPRVAEAESPIENDL